MPANTHCNTEQRNRNAFLQAYNAATDSSWGSTPDLTGTAYSAPPLRGHFAVGGKEKGKKGKGREDRGRKGGRGEGNGTGLPIV